MARIRDRSQDSSNRLSEDRAAYRELLKDVVRQNPALLEDIVAQQSIISSSPGQRVKIPLKALKEPHLKFGFAPEGTAQQPGAGRGDPLPGQPNNQAQQGPGQGPQAGDGSGDETYEPTMELKDLLELLYEHLKLPNLEEKGFGSMRMKAQRKLAGEKTKGTWSRLHRRASSRRHAARRTAAGVDPGQRLSYREEDLRFFGVTEDYKPMVNAVVFCMMDTSGSMDDQKKFLARATFFVLVDFLKRHYQQVNIHFIAHDDSARELSEEQFFTKGSSGGTKISSAEELALELIEKAYDPANWNVYAFHGSDGENSSNDNPRMRELMERLLEIANLAAFFEIRSSGALVKELEPLLKNHSNFAYAMLKEKGDVAKAIPEVLSHDIRSGGD